MEIEKETLKKWVKLLFYDGQIPRKLSGMRFK